MILVKKPSSRSFSRVKSLTASMAALLSKLPSISFANSPSSSFALSAL